MAVPEPLINTAVRHQVFLERLKAGEVRDFDSFLREIDRSIRDRLSREGDLTAFRRVKLEALLEEVRGLLGNIFQRYRGELSDSLQDLAAYEAGFEARALEDVIRGVSVAAPGPTQVWAAVAAAPLSVRGHDGGKLLDALIKGWSEGEIAAVTGRIRQGAFEGQTNAQIIQSIRGTRRLNYRDGVLSVTRRHAAAVVQTAVQHVASEARFQTWAANDDIIDGYRWVSTLDSRTTQICRSLDGRVFQLGKGPKPPIHINCRSTTVPELNDGLDFLDKGATRASAKGPVDADETYYSWLKRQPASFQNEAIGPKRAKLLREGGLNAEEFARLNLGRNFQPLTLDEMRKREPLAFERAGL